MTGRLLAVKIIAVNTSVQLAPANSQGLLLRNPVIAAAGTFGYGDEMSQWLDIQRLGAIVSKGVTLKPREGNAQPRLIETTSGLLNSIGLQNIGVEAVIREKAPVWAGWQVPVIVNIAGESLKEYADVAKRLDGVAGVKAIEVNIGCPNVKAGGIEFGTTPRLAAAVTTRVKKATALPVIVKLSPNVSDIVAIARAVVDAGADAITLINTLRGMAIDIKQRCPALGNTTGGLSGPAIKPVALYMVYRVAGAVRMPVIGCGGIVTAQDALEFLMAGASAVQVGTANFLDPAAALGIAAGIEEYMSEHGLSNLGQVTGSALDS